MTSLDNRINTIVNSVKETLKDFKIEHTKYEHELFIMATKDNLRYGYSLTFRDIMYHPPSLLSFTICNRFRETFQLEEELK